MSDWFVIFVLLILAILVAWFCDKHHF